MQMNKVYIVKRTDGECINIDKVFLTLNKAKLIKEDIEDHGFQWEDYYIDEYEVIK